MEAENLSKICPSTIVDMMHLKGKDHYSNASRTFNQLWGDRDFSDVTLATADGQQIRAHKVIISSSSLFFKTILVKNPHPNPLIYLNGVRYTHLENVLKFIYSGQCEVSDDDLQDFLTTGEDLGITSLADFDESRKDHFDLEVQSAIEKPGLVDEERYDKFAERSIQSEYKNAMNKYECGYSATQNGKSKHESVRYQCDQCDYKASQQSNLTTHKKAMHEGVRYTCDQCGFTATQQSSLSTHKNAKHDGEKYSCDECHYKATTSGNLISHKQVKHEGVKYDCPQCDHKSTTKRNLTSHIEREHDRNVEYFCDLCGAKCNNKGSLTRHRRSVHLINRLIE
jgi:predicted RNA-binding Zn-ribbon protein involved in translation (DUF1610 family)